MKVSFDRVANIYDKTRGLPQEVMKKTVQTLVKELKGHRTVLDIGVGTGRFAQPLQQNGFTVVGIDISRDMMREAKKKGVQNLIYADACCLPFRESAFDAALLVHILHLISDWQTALEEVCRVVKSALFSVITKPRRKPISEAYEELAKRRSYDAGHIGLGERELTEKIEPAKTVHAASMVSNADEHLAYLKQRAYSRQWRIPEDVNKQIVEELEKQFAGQKYRIDTHVAKWNMKDMKAYLKTQTRK